MGSVERESGLPLFWSMAVRIIAGVGAKRLIGYILRGSDGSLAPDGSLIWEELSGETRQQNRNTGLFEDHFEPRPIRFLEFSQPRYCPSH